MPQTYRTSHLTLQDVQNNKVSAEDLIELCIERGEEYGDFGFSSYVSEDSIVAALQPTAFAPPSPFALARLEHDLLHGIGEGERSAREKAIRSLLQDKRPPYEEALALIEQRWQKTQDETREDGSKHGISKETLSEWAQGDLYQKVAIMHKIQYPPPEDPRDVEILLHDGHPGNLKTVRLQSTDSIEKVTSVLNLLSEKRDAANKVVDSGTGPWMYQLMNARKKSVIRRRKLVTDRDYRTMVLEIKGRNTKTPYAIVMQESTPVKMTQEGFSPRKKVWKPVKGVDFPEEDVVSEDGTVLTADIDWDEFFGKEGLMDLEELDKELFGW